MGIGDHCCEVCGKMYDNIGEYFDCLDNHEEADPEKLWKVFGEMLAEGKVIYSEEPGDRD